MHWVLLFSVFVYFTTYVLNVARLMFIDCLVGTVGWLLISEVCMTSMTMMTIVNIWICWRPVVYGARVDRVLGVIPEEV